MIGEIIGWMKLYVDYRTVGRIIDGEKSRGTFPRSLAIVAIAQGIVFFSIAASYMIANLIAPSGENLLQTFGGLLLLNLLGFTLFYLTSFIMFLIARALGGKGSLDAQIHLLAIFALCNNIVTVPFITLASLPVVGPFLYLAAIVVGLYSIYAQFLAVRSLHGFSNLRAALVLALTLVVFVLFTSVLNVLIARIAGIAI
ncbi:MAG: hypothetical protein U0R44_03910 [Candidatus Micrarchaeia archaeon]